MDDVKNIMANVYYKLIKNNKRTFEQVPANLREDVKALLENEVASQSNNSQR